MKDKKLIIAGGTGFIGQALAEFFGKENQVIVLSRNGVNSHTNNNSRLLLPEHGYHITYRRWDGTNVEKHWAQELEKADILINLSGKSVNCRYTEKNKKEIFDSRTYPTQILGEAIRNCIEPPKLWINASSATIYRHATDKPQNEYTGDIENDFSVQVCKQWEKAFYDQRTPFTRKIVLRMAITLGKGGGVMSPYFKLAKFFMAGKQGDGNQQYSWVHAEDVCRMIEWLYEQKNMEGTFNCVSPNAVTNNIFMHTLRKITGHKIGIPLYSWMLKLGKILVGTEPELLLKSRWVIPTKLLEKGFTFKYNYLEEALQEIVSKTPEKQYRFFR
jgi:uncharacterized protein